MAHFYGTLQGNRGQATRCGTKKEGLTTTAASWKGMISVIVWYEEDTGRDRFQVIQQPWQGAGVAEVIASGVIGEKWNTPENLIEALAAHYTKRNPT